MLAGMRIEPPPSPACATGTMPLATAAAEPPLDPPALRVGVPRVARRAVRLGFGRRHQPELGRVRLADDDEARRLELREQVARASARCSSPLCSARLPAWYGAPASVPSRSLTTIGTPRNGPSGSVAARRGARPVEQRVDDGVQLAVQLLDAGDRGVDELDRATRRRCGRARPGRWRRGVRVPCPSAEHGTRADVMRRRPAAVDGSTGPSRGGRSATGRPPSRRGPGRRRGASAAWYATVGSTCAGRTSTRSPTRTASCRRERHVLVGAEPHVADRRSSGCRGPCRAPSGRSRRPRTSALDVHDRRDDAQRGAERKVELAVRGVHQRVRTGLDLGRDGR